VKEKRKKRTKKAKAMKTKQLADVFDLKQKGTHSLSWRER